MYVHSHTCFSLVVIVVVRCSMYLLVCMNIRIHIGVRLCCICVIHLSHTHTDVIVDLLINSSMCIYVSVAFALFFSRELY